jgi:hypothetical protein
MLVQLIAAILKSVVSKNGTLTVMMVMTLLTIGAIQSLVAYTELN